MDSDQSEAKPRRGKIQLIDARNFWIPMKKSLGNKRHKVEDADAGERDDIGEITRIYGNSPMARHES